MRAKRKSHPWKPEEDAYLVANYSTMSASAIAAHLGRTTIGVWKRAERLELSKPNLARFQPGHVPTNKGKSRGDERMPLVGKVIAQLEKHGELSQKEIAAQIGCLDSSVSEALRIIRRPGQRGARVVRWEWQPPRHWIPKYRLGHGEDAPRPKRAKPAPPPKENPYEIQPIPRPALGAWGCVWNTTTASNGQKGIGVAA